MLSIFQWEMLMPWREVKPMDERVLFIGDYLRGNARSFSELCQRYGISRKTGYKWVERYKLCGIEGLNDQSRRPHSHPDAIPYALQQAVLRFRKVGRITLGPKKIQQRLVETNPDTPAPSLTSIYNILKRHGKVSPRRRRRRVSRYPDPFAPVTEPNQLWSVDFKGQFKLRNGQWCYPLTIMDHESRYLLGCDGLDSTRSISAQSAFEKAFRQFGLPERIRSDNGVPFASKAAGGLSHLSAWWVRLGILPERIKPGTPQQNGRHERMHRTLKQAVTKPVARDMASQQRQMDRFVQDYNQERPHEALSQKTPAACYRASPRALPCKLPDIEYPSVMEVRKVRSSGIVYWGNGQVYVSHILVGEHVGFEAVDDGVWEVYFGPIRLGAFDVRERGAGKVPYWSITV